MAIKAAPKDKAITAQDRDVPKRWKHWHNHEEVCKCDKCSAARAKKAEK